MEEQLLLFPRFEGEGSQAMFSSLFLEVFIIGIKRKQMK